jgi:hypothetical protein
MLPATLLRLTVQTVFLQSFSPLPRLLPVAGKENGLDPCLNNFFLSSITHDQDAAKAYKAALLSAQKLASALASRRPVSWT